MGFRVEAAEARYLPGLDTEFVRSGSHSVQPVGARTGRPMTRWVYIAGRGHSGSTILDGMLGNVGGIASVGELVSGMTRYDDACSCGATFECCPYWRATRQEFQERSGTDWDTAARRSVSQAHIRHFPKTFFSSRNADWVRDLIRDTRQIGGALTVENAEIVVDSSKEITRALFLVRFLPETRVIHLVRHPVSVVTSNYHRLSVGKGFKFLRRRYYPEDTFWPALLASCVGWIAGNVLSDIVRMFARGRFLRVKYENLVSEPDRQLDRIEKFLDVPLDEIREKIRRKEPFDIGHNIGGNHLRMAKQFTFGNQPGARKPLPVRYRVLVNTVCFPFLWLYGYGWQELRDKRS